MVERMKKPTLRAATKKRTANKGVMTLTTNFHSMGLVGAVSLISLKHFIVFQIFSVLPNFFHQKYVCFKIIFILFPVRFIHY